MPDELVTILYADDDEDILSVATLSLEMVGGFTVNTCRSGREAIEEARRLRPDLIMLDVMMPGMDGPTAMGKIKADPDLAGIPVILLTARVRGAEVGEYLTLGADGVIAKPFDPMRLSDEVRGIWARAKAGGPPADAP
ncbi:chemotaxis protein CheY [Prosthecomicrobium hirschii]|uniref:Chemotaxis protein CheY n=1 Tax=Prosthecodimorpha hirschii TaxID=665126 RepID=A0A0P6VIK9_9HYPH|nr:response regulator [Prosthecomicrobium hirschii]KPL50927.1 chemotaxis protein CheY [Prosthecomicrobium hirschii]